ncbi:SGNH/GDSL hydrolase family protein [Sphingopyxis sp.]|uniref:SGNH/GDSL hydrolase family protein n=1 Tax=Sphingopyxis sp. TaxID=1908224 RepID=UPI002D79249A|nr:SGNH/GDSL hydrolase family protein [Sphingopyxis sp.]HET6526317.1 SGNH/GDSL hydrolase family protein [Sphingopyxis sp.]
MKSLIFLPLALVSLPVAAGEPTSRVGVVSDPCATLPPMPAVVADYMTRAKAALAAGDPLPPRSEDGMAIYAKWQQDLLFADFAGLCRYAAANRALPPATSNRIVFIGDSITEAWLTKQPDFFSGDRVDRGISGQTTTQMLARFRADVVDLKPRIVHIMAGTNDIAGNIGATSIERIEANIRTMVDLAEAHGIAVVIGSVLPARRFNWRPEIAPVEPIAALNTRLRALAAERNLVFADYYAALDDGEHGLAKLHAEDGVHPTPAGYAVMRPIAERALASAARKAS